MLKESKFLERSSIREAGPKWLRNVELRVSSSSSDGDEGGITVVSSSRVGGDKAGRALEAKAGIVSTGGASTVAEVVARVLLLLVLAAMGECEVGAACWSSSSSEKLMRQGILGAGAEGRAVLQMGSLISAMTRFSCS